MEIAMKKCIIIAFKDLKLALRDRAALILMLLAPFLLTLIIGAVTGSFSGDSKTGMSQIPVVLVNQDEGYLGQALLHAFTSPELQGLVAVTVTGDAETARHQVDDGSAVAAVVVPGGFTRDLAAMQDQATAGAGATLELYTDPADPASAGVIRTILDNFINQVEGELLGGQVAVSQLHAHGLALGSQPSHPEDPGTAAGYPAVALDNMDTDGKPAQFNVLAYLAPAMALMFLMYTVSYGGRSLLEELEQGTLTRLLVFPTNTRQVLIGKIIGIFLLGAAQMLILIQASTFLFGIQWGDQQAVMLLSLAAVFGAAGWGVLLAVISKTPSQAGQLGMVLMLFFSLLGGSFFYLGNMPVWFQTISKVTPIAWGMQGFTTLGLGGSIADITTPILALIVMGLVLMVVSIILFNRRKLVAI
jgi:ABC-2 type transport system permease protein